MTDDEIQTLCDMADDRGLEGLERASFLTDMGVTVPEYSRFERRRTVRFVLVCGLILLAVWVLSWLIVRYH